MNSGQGNMTVKTASTSNEKSSESLTGDEMLKIIMKRLIEQDKIIEKILAKLENQEQALESIQNELKENLEGRDVESVKVIIPENSQNYQSSNFSFTPSKFVVRNVFNDISNILEYGYLDSESEEHFGVKWYISLYCEDENIGISVDCEDVCSDFSIDAEVELSIVHPTGKTYSKKLEVLFDSSDQYGISKFLDWKEMEKDYMVDDKLIVEARVNIRNMKGVYKDDLRCFDDESMKELSDVVLIVKERKFYVLRKFLAIHSTYFKALFLGNFNESKKTEVVLTGIDSEDFQNYLEVLYGDNAIDEMTLEGILLVGDMYDTEIVTRKCEEFLMEKSKKLLKKKLQMAVRYNLEDLKKKCLSEIKTIDDIRSVIPGDIKEMDPSLIAALFEKSLSAE